MNGVFGPALVSCAGRGAGDAVLAGPALAQAPMPSQEQVDILRNMSPEQRDLLLEQLGKEGDASSSGDTNSSTDQIGSRGSNGNARRQGDRAVERKPGDARTRTPGTSSSTDATMDLLEADIFKPGDTLLIDIDLRKPRMIVPPGSPPGTSPIPQPIDPPMDLEEKDKLTRLIELIRSRNPYQLDRGGALLLPGYPPIPLAGLSEDQARLLLDAEATFRRLEIRVTRLPLVESGVAGASSPSATTCSTKRPRLSRPSPTCPCRRTMWSVRAMSSK